MIDKQAKINNIIILINLIILIIKINTYHSIHINFHVLVNKPSDN